MLRLICGRSGTGKSSKCIDEIAAVIENDINQSLPNQSILIVPEQLTVQAEKALLAKINGKGIMSADVVSFRRLANRFINQSTLRNLSIINQAGRRMILYKAVESNKNELVYFSKAINKPGFICEIIEIIDEFGKYGITPEKLELTLESLDADSPLYKKIFELKLIYSSYLDLLHREYIESKDILDLFAEKISENNLFAGSKVWIDEFSGFTPQEYRIIAGIINNAAIVSITLCMDKPGSEQNEDIFNEVSKTYKKLNKLAAEEGIKTERIYLDNNERKRFSSSDALAYLEKSFGRVPAAEAYNSKTEDIEFFEGKDILSEIEHTARRIVGLCRDNDYRFKDIYVLTGSLDKYSHLVETVFDKYEIPHFLDEKKSIENHPLSRLVIYILVACSENYSYEPMMCYLRTGLLNISQDDADLIENHILKRNIYGKRWLDNTYWDDTLVDIKDKIIRPLVQFKSAYSADKTVRGISSAIYKLLVKLGIYENIEKSIDLYKQQSDYNKASELSQMWNVIMDILDQMVNSLDGEKVTLDRYLNIFKAGLADYRIGFIPSTLDCVHVGSIGRSININVKVLFVIGANEGCFPPINENEGIISDVERERLEDKGLELKPGTRNQLLTGIFDVYRTVTSASDKLCISYSCKDTDGKENRISKNLSDIIKLFPNACFNGNRTVQEYYSNPLFCVTRKGATMETLLKVIGDNPEQSDSGCEASYVWQSVIKYFSDTEYKETLDLAETFFRNYDSNNAELSSEGSKELYGGNIYTSVSRIERFNNCPFSFFAEYGLRIKKRDELKFNLPDVGTFIHGVLESFSNRLLKDGISWKSCAEEPETVRKIIDESVSVILENKKFSIFKDSERLNYYAKRLSDSSYRSAKAIAAQVASGDFTPYLFEAGFGANKDENIYPALEIALNNGERVFLNGKVDRIDVYENDASRFFRIIDYKSGYKDFKLSDIYSGLSIQLISYLAAVNRGEPESIPAGAFYFKTGEALVKSEYRMTVLELDDSKRKAYKLDGLTLADNEVVNAMDKNIGRASNIIPVGYKADGSFTSFSKVSTKDELDSLINHVIRGIRYSAGSIKSGAIKPEPVKANGRSPCDYCDYSSVCGFEAGCGNYKYKYVPSYNNADIWNKIKTEETEE